MATGPEHYQFAEEALAEVTNADGSMMPLDDDTSGYYAAAQVHALLAHSAATALATRPFAGEYKKSASVLPDPEFEEWAAAAGSERLKGDLAAQAEAARPKCDHCGEPCPLGLDLCKSCEDAWRKEVEADRV